MVLAWRLRHRRVLAITSPSLLGATGKHGSPRVRVFWLGAGQAGLRVLRVPGEPQLQSIMVCGLVMLQRQGEAAEGTRWMGAAGCVWWHG